MTLLDKKKSNDGHLLLNNTVPVFNIGFAHSSSSNNKTKKIKKTNVDKKLLWDKFDNTINNISTDNTSQIECVFLKNDENEKCDCCDYSLFISDEGFLVCTNKTCGVIYKIIDQT